MNKTTYSTYIGSLPIFSAICVIGAEPKCDAVRLDDINQGCGSGSESTWIRIPKNKEKILNNARKLVIIGTLASGIFFRAGNSFI